MGTSWTEPTCYALLALRAWETNPPERSRGREWLLGQQRADGGWAPQSLVKQSTWVTSLASLCLAGNDSEHPGWIRSLEWLDLQVGRSSSALDRVRAWMFNSGSTKADASGWSWFPGTASWVTPTAMAIVALSKGRARSTERLMRIVEGKKFLLSRRCVDGGWNHGGTFFRSESAPSYPETTGAALIGLQGESQVDLARSLDLAESLLPRAGSVEGMSWLQVALAAHGRRALPMSEAYPCRTTVDLSLRVIAEAARAGANTFAVQQA